MRQSGHKSRRSGLHFQWSESPSRRRNLIRHQPKRPQVRVVVIGGGVAGLSAAIQLAAEGAAVLLIDLKGTLGGRVRMQESGDWVLDSGLHLMRRRGPFQQLLRRLRAPRVLGKKWDAARLFPVGCDATRARQVLSSMRLEGSGEERLILPAGGWSSIVGRLILGARELGVEILVEKPAEAVILDDDNRVKAVRVAGEEVDCDAVVLAIPPKAAAALLAETSLATDALESCSEHRVAAIDAALMGKPMGPYAGYWGEDSGVLIIDATQPDRLSERGSVEECTIIHAVCLHADGEEGLDAIKSFLDSRCSGWRNMVAARRSTESIMLHPCSAEERLDGELYLENRIVLAGTHVANTHELSDAAVDSGRKAAKALMRD